MSDINTSKRKDFISYSASIASVTILASGTLRGENAPSNQFRFAQIGAGGKGKSDMNSTIRSGGKLVAICDVDSKQAAESINAHPDKPLYTDYRELLDKHEKDLDGVVVSTPDHTHACVALDAIKRGKHVYVQKPLARTYQECQVLLDAAKKYKVVTQMGNQGHSGSGLKTWQKMFADKAFGEIKELHSWSDRPVWPQGMTGRPSKESIPKTLNWDQWLGPIQKCDYSAKYLPFNWRGWWDFGCGAMGDMACHNMDPLFWIFKLGEPDKIMVKSSAPAGLAYPAWSIIEYTFNDFMGKGRPIKLTWYDGKKYPKLPEGCHPERTPGGNGCMVIGSKMSALGGSHAARPLPIAIAGKEYGSQVKELERHWRRESKKLDDGDHYLEWINAAKKGDQNATGSNFDYSTPFTQSILLGCIALRYPNQELLWDKKQRKFTNFKEANQWLSFKPRKGYDLTVV